jgi:hypothetical protein
MLPHKSNNSQGKDKMENALAPHFLVFCMKKEKTCKYERTTYKKKIDGQTRTMKEDRVQYPS